MFVVSRGSCSSMSPWNFARIISCGRKPVRTLDFPGSARFQRASVA
jgi:hypothetical protein